MTSVVAIDLGGTKALAGLVGRDGSVSSRVWLSSRDLVGRPAELLDRLANGAHQAAREAGVADAAVSALGICVPGPLDQSRSVVALAEQALGAGRGCESLLAVFIGSGVGGGFVVNGRLYHGAHGGAGEIGHLVVRAAGPRCGCGRAGCLEAMSARDAVGRYVMQAVARGQKTVLSEMLHGNLRAFTSRDLAAAVAQHDAVALRAARRSARYVGLAVGGVVNLLDPATVVLGGGILEAVGQRYVDWVAEIARRQILSSGAKDVPIVASVLGDDAGLLGAALTAFAE